LSGQEEAETGNRLLVAMVVLLHTFNHMIGGGLPILYPDIMDEFGLSYSQLGLLRSASTLAAGFPQMFVGFLRRWFSGRVLIGAGNLVNSVMNIGISVSRGFYQFLGLSVLGGVGSSTQHPMGASIITTATEPSRRGRMLGLNQSVPSLAFSFTPLLAAYLVIRLGWRTTLSVLAAPALVASLAIIFLVKGGESAEAKTRDAFSLAGLREALRHRNVIAISLLRSVMAFRMGVRTFLPLYFINVLGLAAETSSLLYSVMLFGGVLGPFFWGNLSDRMNRKPLIMGIMAASSVLYFLLQFVVDLRLLAAVLFMIGFLVQTVVVQNVLSDSVEPGQLDQIFGFYFTLGFTVGSVSSILFGYIVEFFGFGWGFTYIAGVTLVSMVPALFIVEPRGDGGPGSAPLLG
jgi:FSR family fosmidomycin resistance protein-like MFS transporter